MSKTNKWKIYYSKGDKIVDIHYTPLSLPFLNLTELFYTLEMNQCKCPSEIKVVHYVSFYFRPHNVLFKSCFQQGYMHTKKGLQVYQGVVADGQICAISRISICCLLITSRGFWYNF